MLLYWCNQMDRSGQKALYTVGILQLFAPPISTADDRKWRLDGALRAESWLRSVFSEAECWEVSEPERGATAAAHVTWPPRLLLADWSALAGNKKHTIFSAFSSSLSVSHRVQNPTHKSVFALNSWAPPSQLCLHEVVRGVFRNFFFLLSYFPASNVGTGLCCATRPFSGDLTPLCC